MLYDITKSYEENLAFGPYWEGKFPAFRKESPKYSFLGYKLNSLFGVPACPLTVNARSIDILGELGYDILTYKSVRSMEWHGNEFPHWLYVDVRDKTPIEKIRQLKASLTPFYNSGTTMVNSFGIHSLKPEYWQQDFHVASHHLAPGKLVILSMQTTPQTGRTAWQDGKVVAKLGLEAGAQVFEINFACPNTDGGQGMIFEDVETSYKVCVAIKEAIGNRPLLVKVGFYTSDQTLQKFMKRLHKVIAGISSTNTYPLKIVDKKGKDAFPKRPMAGVSGAAIRLFSMAQAEKIVKFKQQLGLKTFVVIGIGGVTKHHHIGAYLNLGVDAVQSAVGPFADPYLASKYKKTL